MKASYKDILSRVTAPPLWWDSNGVPRFEEFHPKLCPNVYADQVVLLHIACQGCGHLFDVELNWDKMMIYINAQSKPLSDNPTAIFYGDPPDVNCCPAGPTMSSISLYVKQFWAKENSCWLRRNEWENIQIESLEEYFGHVEDFFVQSFYSE